MQSVFWIGHEVHEVSVQVKEAQKITESDDF